MTLTLRDRLRRDTAPDHAAAARALAATGCLDQRDPRAFLTIQARSLLARLPAARGTDPETALARRLYRSIRAALAGDLGTLPDMPGLPNLPAPPDLPAAPDAGIRPVLPTGFAYVALGGTAGIAILAPRWTGPRRFLDLMAGLRADWTALSDRLAGAPATGLRAEHAVAAARTVFAAVVAACGTGEGPCLLPPSGPLSGTGALSGRPTPDA